jgi:hypothetical protein
MHCFLRLVIIKTWISSLVHIKRSWNKLHQVTLKIKTFESHIIKKKHLGARKPE